MIKGGEGERRAFCEGVEPAQGAWPGQEMAVTGGLNWTDRR